MRQNSVSDCRQTLTPPSTISSNSNCNLASTLTEVTSTGCSRGDLVLEASRYSDLDVDTRIRAVAETGRVAS
ncbi:hypothetical protein OH76DRAFT_551405 [Lentinus brumalis]|uniref:Uncharacterized protein n=1 Tax=Lentinus brumalis TaxID=2498619 RepID=A0A371D9Y2_9APHY|nr:hypothetical protein OH76DRAFT_551405 [Polyporus brumalis]